MTSSLSRSMAATVSGSKPAQAGVARAAVEQRAERRLPAGAERGDPQRAQQLLARVPGEVQQRVDFRDRHLLLAGGDLDDVVARLHLALLEHPEVEARTAVGDQQRRDARILHPQPDPVTGDPGLGELEQRAADPVAVADAGLVVAEPLHGEVFAELPVDEVASPQLALPVAIGLDLVDEDRALLAAVAGEVTLAVALHVEPADATGAADGLLEDAREHGPALPRHLLRHADVDRQQGPHHLPRKPTRMVDYAAVRYDGGALDGAAHDGGRILVEARRA
jgi:hypothetical protein